MNADDLFTAPQVAKICSTDLKTIHNWVNRGEIKSFRTPGRHLRFRRQDILDFLGRFGYPIPDGFAPARRRIVLCENKDTARRSIKRALARDFEVEAFSDHVDALLAIGKQRPSLLLFSGEASEDMGHLIDRLSSGKEAAPIVIYGNDSDYSKYTEKANGIELVPTTDSKEIRRCIVSLLGK